MMQTRPCLVIGSIPLLLLVAAMLYWPGLNGPFVLDDWHNIVANHVGEFDRDEILYVMTHNTSGLLGRPVAVLSFVFSGLAHGPEPWGYKYHNLLIHLLNGVLLFWLIMRLLPRMAPTLEERKSALVAIAVTAGWLLHPLMVSTVLYSVQRMAELSALFTLAALLSYVYARESLDGGAGRFYLLAYLVFPLSMVLAVLSKENGALVPLYVLVLELIVFRFEHGHGKAKFRLFTFLGIFLAAPLLLGGAYALTHLDELANFSTRTFTMYERLLTQLHVVTFYLKLILLPNISQMTLFHDDVELVTSFDAATLFLLLSLVLLIGLIFYLRRKAPVASLAIAWFLVSHLLESTFVSLELVFEHRNYLAAVGPLLALFYYVLVYGRNGIVKALPVVYIALLAFLTHTRVLEWSDNELFYTLAVTEHPDSFRARTEYANVQFRRGQPEEALKELEAAVKLNPYDFGPLLHQAAYLCTGEPDEARRTHVASLMEEASGRARAYPVSPYGLSAVEALFGRKNGNGCANLDFHSLLELVQTAIVQEDNQRVPKHLGFLQRIEGKIHMLHGRYMQGVESLVAAYRNTGMALILVELVEMQLILDRLQDAESFIAELERVNAISGDREAHLLEPLREKVEQFKLERTGDQKLHFEAE